MTRLEVAGYVLCLVAALYFTVRIALSPIYP